MLEQPAAAGTAKKAMEQNQPDPLPQPHPLPQPQPTAPVATRFAPQLSMVRIKCIFFLSILSISSVQIRGSTESKKKNKEKARKL